MLSGSTLGLETFVVGTVGGKAKVGNFDGCIIGGTLLFISGFAICCVAY